MNRYTADQLLAIPEEEIEFRESLEAVLNLPSWGSDVTDLERKIHVTPFEGAYGQAGIMLTINGSPPRAMVLVTTNLRDNYVFVFRRPYRSGSVIEIKPRTGWDEGRIKKHLRFHDAVFAYLKMWGDKDQ